MKLVKDTVYADLPDIDSSFDVVGKTNRAFMAIVDENFVNGVFRSFAKNDKNYGVRDFIKNDARFS